MTRVKTWINMECGVQIHTDRDTSDFGAFVGDWYVLLDGDDLVVKQPGQYGPGGAEKELLRVPAEHLERSVK